MMVHWRDTDMSCNAARLLSTEIWKMRMRPLDWTPNRDRMKAVELKQDVSRIPCKIILECSLELNCGA